MKKKVHDELLEHPLYSPELVSSDYQLFQYQKSFLGDQRFNTDEETETAVKVWLSSQAAALLEEELQKLVGRSKKILKSFKK